MDTAATNLLTAIVTLKGMYDQHLENKEEIKEVQAFLEEYQEQLPALHRRFHDCEGNNLGAVALKLLEGDISDVTNKLVEYAKNGTFFFIFNSRERMQELQKLHRNVMASVQKNVGIASLSMLLDERTSQFEMQGGLMRSTSELKSLVTTSMTRMSREVAREVRAEVVQASRTAFTENEKFWADVLAAVDRRELLQSDSMNFVDKSPSILDDSDQCTERGSNSGQSYQLYMDPITDELFIDPVITSNGETYDRWTIIDHNLTKDPLNPSADLQILGDNISVRRALFDDFPDQWKKFRQRRDDYRFKALALAKKGLIADAVLALQHVMQWDRNDKECGEALARAKAALEDALHAQHEGQAPLLQQHKHEITETAAVINPAISNLEPSSYQPVHVTAHLTADVPKSPMSAISNEDHDEIWIIPDPEQDLPSKGMSPTPEIFRPMKDIKTIRNAHSGNWVESVSYSPDGARIATTGFDKTAKVWDAEKGKVLFTLKDHKYLVRSSAWSPTGNELATGSYDKTTKVWDTKRGELLYTLKGHQDRVNSVAWNPNGHSFATGSDDGTAILWDVKSREAIATLPANIGAVSSVAWSPDGLLLAVAYKLKSVRVWDVTQRKVVFELKCEDGGNFNHVAWSPVGCEFAAASSNHTTVVCDAASGDVRLTLRGHSHEVVYVAWSPDGTRLATASKDKTALVWNALSGAALFPLRRHSSPLSSLAWRNDGARLATASEGGSLTIWRHEHNGHDLQSTPRLTKSLSFKSCRTNPRSFSFDQAPPKLAKLLGLKSGQKNPTSLPFWSSSDGKKKRENSSDASMDQGSVPSLEGHIDPSLEDRIVLRRRPKHQGELLYQYPWSYRGREMPFIVGIAKSLHQRYIQFHEFEKMCSANNIREEDKFEIGRGRLTATLFLEAFLYHLQSLIRFRPFQHAMTNLQLLRRAG